MDSLICSSLAHLKMESLMQATLFNSEVLFVVGREAGVAMEREDGVVVVLLVTVGVDIGGAGRLDELGKSRVDRRLLVAGVEAMVALAPW